MFEELELFFTALQMYKTHFRNVLWSQKGHTFQNNKIKSAPSSTSGINQDAKYSK